METAERGPRELAEVFFLGKLRRRRGRQDGLQIPSVRPAKGARGSETEGAKKKKR